VDAERNRRGKTERTTQATARLAARTWDRLEVARGRGEVGIEEHRGEEDSVTDIQPIPISEMPQAESPTLLVIEKHYQSAVARLEHGNYERAQVEALLAIAAQLARGSGGAHCTKCCQRES